MSTLSVCLAFLYVSGAFALISLGVLLIRAASSLKEITLLSTKLDETVEKVNKTLDDVNYKLDQLNPPVELINRAFTKPRSNTALNIASHFMSRRKKK